MSALTLLNPKMMVHPDACGYIVLDERVLLIGERVYDLRNEFYDDLWSVLLSALAKET
jgi:hypothetical protein